MTIGVQLSTTQEYQVKMSCGGCANAVRKALSSCPGLKLNNLNLGIENVDIDLERQTITIKGIATPDCVQKALQSTGKSFSPIIK
jgi:copper chaperone